MPRYRKVNVCFWSDAKVRGLSRDSRYLFLVLLTHTHMTSVGAMCMPLSGLREFAKFETDDEFNAALDPLIDSGMVEVDRETFFIGLPNFIRHNAPESPNSVVHWGYALNELPECELKNRLIERLDAQVSVLPDSFRVAWQRACSKALICPSPRATEGLAEGLVEPFAIQEQEQEQEQEQRKHKRPSRKKRADGPDEESSALYTIMKQYMEETWLAAKGYSLGSVFMGAVHWKPFATMIRRVAKDPSITIGALKAAWDRFVATDDGFVAKQGLGYFSTHLNMFLPTDMSAARRKYSVSRTFCEICGSTGRVALLAAPDGGTFTMPWTGKEPEGTDVRRCSCALGKDFEGFLEPIDAEKEVA